MSSWLTLLSILAHAAGFVDMSKLVVCGGSHGGFVAGHLLGQYPDTFR
jgi:dipeptidyl aminopeptidase/acylaminoacyl peptidase